MKTCGLCGKEFIRVDGTPGNSSEDSKMINDYLTMTDWYKNQKPTWFKITRPNPYACRVCIKLLVDAGLKEFVGGDAQKFLTTQEWWKRYCLGLLL